MKVNPINNNQTSFGAKFQHNKVSAQLMKHSEKATVKEFITSIKNLEKATNDKRVYKLTEDRFYHSFDLDPEYICINLESTQHSKNIGEKEDYFTLATGGIYVDYDKSFSAADSANTVLKKFTEHLNNIAKANEKPQVGNNGYWRYTDKAVYEQGKMFDALFNS